MWPSLSLLRLFVCVIHFSLFQFSDIMARKKTQTVLNQQRQRGRNEEVWASVLCSLCHLTCWLRTFGPRGTTGLHNYCSSLCCFALLWKLLQAIFPHDTTKLCFVFPPFNMQFFLLLLLKEVLFVNSCDSLCILYYLTWAFCSKYWRKILKTEDEEALI